MPAQDRQPKRGIEAVRYAASRNARKYAIVRRSSRASSVASIVVPAAQVYERILETLLCERVTSGIRIAQLQQADRIDIKRGQFMVNRVQLPFAFGPGHSDQE